MAWTSVVCLCDKFQICVYIQAPWTNKYVVRRILRQAQDVAPCMVSLPNHPDEVHVTLQPKA
ncbi:MAG: hypothetical protein OZ917_05200 [Candidatus Brocadiaceae bacterium]|nr:hypothetical protein [Candidatus Brocadiaceae bacterium]